MTLAELGALIEARQARDDSADWQTARVVAMLVAVNSKHRRYEPVKYMANGAAIRRRQEAERAAAGPPAPLDGERVIQAFRSAGMTIIDKRTKRA